MQDIIQCYADIKDANGNQQTPELQEFVTQDSLLLFKHLNWRREQLDVFREPFGRYCFTVVCSNSTTAKSILGGVRRECSETFWHL